jgi:hypothetical protein
MMKLIIRKSIFISFKGRVSHHHHQEQTKKHLINIQNVMNFWYN